MHDVDERSAEALRISRAFHQQVETRDRRLAEVDVGRRAFDLIEFARADVAGDADDRPPRHAPVPRDTLPQRRAVGEMLASRTRR